MKKRRLRRTLQVESGRRQVRGSAGEALRQAEARASGRAVGAGFGRKGGLLLSPGQGWSDRSEKSDIVRIAVGQAKRKPFADALGKAEATPGAAWRLFPPRQNGLQLTACG